MSIDAIIDGLMAREGGYVDHKDDKGGATAFGITEATARSFGYTGLMRDLRKDMARHIYRRQYIDYPGFDKIIPLSARIAEEMIDTGVNMGVSLPGTWLQRILNVLNQQSKLFPDLVVDGVLGAATLGALRQYLAHRGPDGEKVVLRALNCLQGERYIVLAEKRDRNESFVFGWMLNRVEVA